jgi:citrate lyase beta subunit
MSSRERYATMRSILEVPILIEKYWSKVPHVAADAIMIDLEDAAVPASKTAARDRAVEALQQPEYFGGRRVIVRANNLATPWGEADLAALAAVDADFLVCYPKVQDAEELRTVIDLLATSSSERGLHVMIETARAVARLDEIAATPGVHGLHFGYVDYAADLGSKAFDDLGEQLQPEAGSYAKARIAVAAAAHGLFATGGTLIPDFKDLDKVRRFVRGWADVGYTACIALSPAHVDIVNEELSPTPAEVEAARALCATYEACIERGEPAAVMDGRVVTMPDYRIACLALARVGETRPTDLALV